MAKRERREKTRYHTFPDGSTIELFTIQVLGEYVGRSQKTIRRWEIGGIIPKTPFKDERGFRLYSIEMMEAMRECAERSGIMEGRNMERTRFRVYVHDAIKPIVEKYALMQKGELKDGTDKEDTPE